MQLTQPRSGPQVERHLFQLHGGVVQEQRVRGVS